MMRFLITEKNNIHSPSAEGQACAGVMRLLVFVWEFASEPRARKNQ